MGPSCKILSTTTTAGLLLLCIVSFLAELVLVHGHGGLVPALYVLGDSQADVGNNNYLVTPARADFPRNGIDYPGRQATGRFSNGYNFVDFLAGSLGLASPPAYHSIRDTAGGSSNSRYLNGVNFASGGAGVSDLTNKGQCFSFNDQIERDYLSVHSELVRQLGQPQAAAHLSKSIFVVAIGGNDIILRALPPAAGELTVEVAAVISLSPQEFVHSLAQTLKRQLQRLYDLGMRRLFFVGAAPIGCVPLMRELSLSRLTTGECHQGANDMSGQYNAAVASLLADMRTQHQDLHCAFFDTYTALMRYIDEPEANGYAEVKAACCGLGDKNAMYRCGRVSTVCPNRSNHVFWDFVHPTEATSRKLTGIAFNGSQPLVSPINVRKLCG